MTNESFWLFIKGETLGMRHPDRLDLFERVNLSERWLGYGAGHSAEGLKSTQGVGIHEPEGRKVDSTSACRHAYPLYQQTRADS